MDRDRLPPTEGNREGGFLGYRTHDTHIPEDAGLHQKLQDLSFASSESWPMARNDRARTAYTEGSGPTGTFEIKWRRDLTLTYSVIGGTLIATEPNAYGPALSLVDIETGTETWRWDYDETTERIVAADPSSLRLYVASLESPLQAFSRKTQEGWIQGISQDISCVQSGLRLLPLSDGVAVGIKGGIIRYSQTGKPVQQDIPGDPVLASTEESIYFLDYQTIGRVDSQSLELQWMTEVEGVEGSHFESSTWVGVDGDVVYGITCGQLFAFDVSTGDQLWDFHLNTYPTEIAIGPDLLYLPTERGLVGLDPVTCESVWRFGESDHSLVSPVATDELVYTGEYMGDSASVFGLDPSSGEVRCRLEELGPLYSLSLGSGRLFANTGDELVCIG